MRAADPEHRAKELDPGPYRRDWDLELVLDPDPYLCQSMNRVHLTFGARAESLVDIFPRFLKNCAAVFYKLCSYFFCKFSVFMLYASKVSSIKKDCFLVNPPKMFFFLNWLFE